MNIARWTGHEARALRQAMRMSQRAFAVRLGVNDAAVSHWEKRADKACLRYETQQLLDTLLEQADDGIQERFEALVRAGGRVDSGELQLDATGVDQTSARSVSDDQQRNSRLGLVWQTDVRVAISTVAGLWNAELQRRSAVVDAAWLASAFAAPARDWLLDWLDADTSYTGGRQVGQSDANALWQMCHMFADIDHRLGGGYAGSTLAHFVTEVALPLLDGTYRAETGRQLMAATARLCDLGGFMAFDSGSRHGLAQRYYIQALRLAQAGRDRALGAHILADMSMQAQHLGDLGEAVALARAGQRTARDCGCAAALARCAAMEARAYARSRDARACGQAMNRAERALSQASSDDEPPWIKFFTIEQLSAEFMYAAYDLDDSVEVQRLAAAVPTADGAMQRRHVLTSATLASSYLMPQGSSKTVDVDQACATLATVIPIVATMTSYRGIAAVNKVRRRLNRYGKNAAVRKVEAELQAVLGAPSRLASQS